MAKTAIELKKAIIKQACDSLVEILTSADLDDPKMFAESFSIALRAVTRAEAFVNRNADATALNQRIRQVIDFQQSDDQRTKNLASIMP